jgi:Flp pilus assembly protein TadD
VLHAAPSRPPGARWADLGIGLAIFLGTLLLYARTAGYPFIGYDDAEYVVKNWPVPLGLRGSTITWAFSSLQLGNWHPLTWLSYLLDVSLFGLRPGPMHAVNAALHAASAVLLFTFLQRATRSSGVAALVAAIFAVHPAHVESVAWISERKDVLSVFFGLLALLAYLRYAERPGPWRYGAVALAFAASLMSKATLVTLPFLLLLLDAWPLARFEGFGQSPRAPEELPRRPWWRLLVEKLPLLALSAAASVMAMVGQGGGGAIASVPLPLRLSNAVVSVASYAGTLLWPSGLAVIYPFPEHGLPVAQVMGATLFALIVTGVALRFLRAAPWLAVGWFWFIGTLVPVIGLVQIGVQARADRYTYFPSIGFYLALAWALRSLQPPVARRVASWGAWSGVAGLALVSHLQIPLWSDTERLFRRAVEVTGENPVARSGLGYALREQGRLDEAQVHLAEAVRIRADPSLLVSLGLNEAALGRVGAAEGSFRRALELEPSFEPASVGLAELLVKQGRHDEAVEALKASSPSSRVGRALLALGKTAQAIATLEAAVAANPGHPEPLVSLAAAHWSAGDAGRAERAADAALATGAVSAPSLLLAGVTRAARGDLAGAARKLQELVRVDPTDASGHLALASVLVRAGRVEEACAELEIMRRFPATESWARDAASREASAAGCAAGGAAGRTAP